MSEAPRVRMRRGYLDWARGIAVLIMIVVHLTDSWTNEVSRQGAAFIWTIKIGGFGSTMFLFLAGTAVALSAGSKARKFGDMRRATRAVVYRGLQIFGLAFLFRLQSWLISGGSAWVMLRVDILNIMGLSIAAAAAVWGLAKTPRARYLAFGVVTLAIALLTPPVRGFAPLAALPDPIEAYFRPVPLLVNFVLFPWAGFVFAGAIVGLLIDATTTPEREQRLNVGFAVAGASLFGGGYAASFLPSVYPNSDFWTTSPSYFAMRVGVVLLLVAVAYAWERLAWPKTGTPTVSDSLSTETVSVPVFAPIQQLGRTSLFIYWIHVEMVYGVLSAPLHRALTYPQAFAGFCAFTLLMLALSVAKDRVVARWRLSAKRPTRS